VILRWAAYVGWLLQRYRSQAASCQGRESCSAVLRSQWPGSSSGSLSRAFHGHGCIPLRGPHIHDITTDIENPPRLVSVLPLRKNAENSAEYGGPEIAAQQHTAYPDIVPLMLPMRPAQAFERALATARHRGWMIADANPAEGRIEATATTFWFGFKDDVVIRIVPVTGGSRLDMRSVSRVGVSDVGTNAARIRSYLKELGRSG
jgi:uncharacterized protein (DUF1499 family)